MEVGRQGAISTFPVRCSDSSQGRLSGLSGDSELVEQ